ncbi:RcnB family protein [Rhodanobacter sp. Col0626]|uniref:RcnB family protein n=1 Tax=Rhodanobacter sp. Col0626 TaxID=3415679 RepID=UPI003CF934C2
MKRFLVILAGGMLLATTAAMAGPQSWRHDQDHHDDHGRHDQGHHDDHGRHDNHDRHGYDHGHGYYVVHDRGRHEGWYRRGGYVPMEYRDSRYVVGDWRARRLREPPRGYHWIRSDDGQFLLVAIASGVIADILLSN